MSEMDDAVERTRKVLYADKTNEQIIMLALEEILKQFGGAPVIRRELYVRYKQPSDRE